MSCRIFAFIIFTLLLVDSMGFISSNSVVNSATVHLCAGNKLYVGGAGPNNYTKIQDAINDSINGDTVFVFDDSSPYNENVIINKRIDVLGENQTSTIIDGIGIGCCITICSDDVTLSCFRIQNTGNEFQFDAVKIQANNTKIEQNIIMNTEAMGIDLSTSNDNYIHKNILLITHSTCIYAYDSHDNVILDNTIQGENINGIYLSFSNNNSILNNSFSQTSDILTEYSNKTVIMGNVFSIIGHQGPALDLHGSDNVISNNLIQTPGGTGLILNMCNNALVTNNNFVYNQLHVLCFYCLDKRVILVGPISARNDFENNYWGEPRKLPMPIHGLVVVFFPVILPWVEFDWHPAQEPFDIP